jgi:MFS family permease
MPAGAEKPAPESKRWVTRAVIGIVLATFLSDVGHEMVTAVLPLYLASVGLGAAALGFMEGLADLLFSVSKLAGGLVGHRAEKKRPWGTLGYVLTTLGTGAIAFTSSVASLIPLRGVAWFGRGFRSPLRDFLLSDEVGTSHFGRAYGIERAADMLGAVAGPLVAVLLIWLGVDFRTVIIVSIAPSALSAAAFFFMTRDRAPEVKAAPTATPAPSRLPRAFWMFVIGVFLFGLGDFSRTFLIFLAARGLGEGAAMKGTLSVAVVLYALHNGVSAIAAYPAGKLGDRYSRRAILLVGYGLGVITNALLAVFAGSLAWLVVAVALSGIYIAIEETLEKAVAAELLPRELRSLGFGILACANAVGDMGSSVYVGVLLDAGRATLAFAVPAAVGLVGLLWMLIFTPRTVAVS